MAFELPEPTQITVRNANPRTELHGEDRVRAIDIAFAVTGENTLLDQIQPGLREHHYWNKAMTAGQVPLPDVLVPLPDLRFPALPLTYKYALSSTGRVRGYRFIWDWGTDDAHVDFSDVALSNLSYELMEGGSVKVFGTISYNGDELQDNALYGELSGLGADGEIYVRLLAPADVQPAKKGYRAGRPDSTSPGKNPAQGELPTGDDGGDDDPEAVGGDPDPDDLDPGSPEGALAATEDEQP